MPGTLALVGAGEFLERMQEVDRELLARAGGMRVAVLPTASAPDGAGVPERWGRMGVEHFSRLGAQAEAVMALDHAACDDTGMADRVEAANLVYFSGGKPNYLRDTLYGTAVWEAVLSVLNKGGVVAGCSAGAMIMGMYLPVLGGGMPNPSKWQPGFALVLNAVIVPHYNEFPEIWSNLWFDRRPVDSFLIGVDADTALVGMKADWQVMGARRVTVRRGKRSDHYQSGQSVTL